VPARSAVHGALTAICASQVARRRLLALFRRYSTLTRQGVATRPARRLLTQPIFVGRRRQRLDSAQRARELHLPRPRTTSTSPPGYKFCGYKDFVNGGWTHDPPDGASLVLFARKMSCHTARQKLKRVRYGTKPPYRCSRRGHPKVALRWETGS